MPLLASAMIPVSAAGIHGRSDAAALDRSVALARTAGAATDVAATDVRKEQAGFVGPSRLAAELARRHGAKLSGDQRAALRTLDELSVPAREAFARLIDAFLRFEDSARDVSLEGSGPALLSARSALLDAVVRLAAVQAGAPIAGLSVRIPAALTIQALDGDDTYTQDAPLIVDLAGNDVYLNNAGGVNGGAAAVIDLAGNDVYGSGSRDLGANGGGVAGAGFLLDAGGDDLYRAGGFGTNGGGYFFGSGFLLDAGGNDVYTADLDCGVNGGGCTIASGTLIDGGGNDSYSAVMTRFVNGGVNGGDGFGRGLLLDAAGSDLYRDPVVPGGSARDCTLVPKEGPLGAQLDLPNLACGGGPAPGADLTLTKTDSPDPVSVGQDLTYLVTVTNVGPGPASVVTVVDQLPAGVAVRAVGASQGICLRSQTVTCVLGMLPAGTTATINIVVLPAAAGTLTNTARASSPEPDPNPSNNSSTATTTVQKK